MWTLHYKSELGSFLEESYKSLSEMYEAMELLFEEHGVRSFRVRFTHENQTV